MSEKGEREREREGEFATNKQVGALIYVRRIEETCKNCSLTMYLRTIQL
jgi:hypothetical protein